MKFKQKSSFASKSSSNIKEEKPVPFLNFAAPKSKNILAKPENIKTGKNRYI